MLQEVLLKILFTLLLFGVVLCIYEPLFRNENIEIFSMSDEVYNYIYYEPCIERDADICQKKNRSFKLNSFYNNIELLNSLISDTLKNPAWGAELEGNSLLFLHKVKLLQDVVDDYRVETICEIGFNSGYSALNFLIANTKARIVSFDIFDHFYTPAAVRSLHKMFPNREIAVIAGDSSISTISAFNIISKYKCNVILIDGGHESSQFVKDVDNMRHLANHSFNRIIVDDIEVNDIFNIWFNIPNILVIDEIVSSAFEEILWDFNSTSFSYVFRVKQRKESIAVGIGSYYFEDINN